MPQHKKLSLLTLRLPEPPPNLDPALRQYLQQHTNALQNHFNAVSGLDICSGLTAYDDTTNEGYFLGFAKNVDGVPDGTPVFALRGDNAKVDINGANSTFFVGDRDANKYLEFDGSDVDIGYKSELLGADHFNNTSTYIGDTFMGGITGYDTTGSGGGSTSYSASSGYAQASVNGTSGAIAQIVKNIQYNTVGGTVKGGSTGNSTFDGLTRFKCTVGITTLNATNLDMRIGVGYYAATAGTPSVWSQGGMGFKIKSGNFFAYQFSAGTLGGATSETEYDTGVAASTGTYAFAIEGSSVYINNVECVTNFETPSRVWTGNAYFRMRLENTGASGTTTIRCSQWKVN